MRAQLIRILLAVLTVSLGLGNVQASAAAQAPGGVAEELLDTVTLHTAGGPSHVVFARLTLDYGQSVRLPPAIGMSVHFLVSGVWSVKLVEEAVTPAATPAATLDAQADIDGTPVEPGAEAELTEGSHLIVPPQSAVEIRNTGDEPAVSLAAIVAERVDASAGDGVTWQPIGDPVAVPEGSFDVDLTHIVVQPDVTTDSASTGNTEAIDVVAGPVLLIINPGDLRITRADGRQETLRAGREDPAATPDAEAREETEEEGGPGLVAPPPGTPIIGTATNLNAGDAAVLTAGGTRAFRASGDAPAVVLVIGVCVAAGDGGGCG